MEYLDAQEVETWPFGPEALPPPDFGPRYRVRSMLSEGGMGQLFLAHDRETRREVVLKRLKPSLAADRRSRKTFIREALVNGRLEHPGVVPVHGLDRRHQGGPFYVMRLVRG